MDHVVGECFIVQQSQGQRETTVDHSFAGVQEIGEPIGFGGTSWEEVKTMKNLPVIIQGGMGAGVSNWRLAKAVSMHGQLGVVSGTALDEIIARRLQLGDSDGSVRRALSNFPWPEVAQRVLDAYFIPEGKAKHTPFKLSSMLTVHMKRALIELLVIGNFVEVYLAKEGHHGLVGINYLEKIQLPTLPSLLGAMLAGVDFVLMGAGIPLSIPGILESLSCWETVELELHVEDNSSRNLFTHRFDPKEFFPGKSATLSRPKFLGIVSSDIVAKVLLRKATGFIDGFVIENHTAGGHNAPPRKDDRLQTQSSSQFGQKDIPNIQKIKDLGKPFWLAGGYASPLKLKEALHAGANGIQVGTVFAFCHESGILAEIKQEVLRQCINGNLEVFTDFKASPTGYPFKLIRLKDVTTSRDKGETGRKRICDLGYLRHLYCRGDSEIGYRCPGEPVKNYLSKGGTYAETIGKQCLCNGLLATIGLGQTREEGVELPIVTAGEDFSFVPHLINKIDLHYSAKNVIDYLRR